MTCARCALPAPPGARFCCFGCELADGLQRDASEQAGNVRGRVAVAVFLAMNVMMASMVLYSEDLFADAGAEGMAGFRTLLRWVSVIAGSGVMLLLGAPLLRHAVAGLRAGRMGADLLVSLAVTAAFVASVRGVIDGSTGIYVEAACATLVLITIGRAVESIARQRAAGALAATVSLGDADVALETPDGPVRVARWKVRPGDVVPIAAGALVPVDGRVVEGNAHVSTAMLTGESRARAVGPGDDVLAGSIAEDGALRVEVTAPADASMLARIERLVAAARERRAPIERIADRLAAIVVGATVVLSIGAGLVWGWLEGADRGISVALAVALVACPCSLGIATPLALWGAMGRALSRGVLLRGCDVLEALATVTHAVLDKTGTLTEPIGDVHVLTAVDESGGREALALAVAVEEGSTHPIAAAIRGAAESEPIARRRIGPRRTRPGRGLVAELDGEEVLVGSTVLLSEHGVATEACAADATFHVAKAGRWLASFVIEERITSAARDLVRALEAQGITVEIASGDRPERAAIVATELGVRGAGGLLPEDKLARVEALAAGGARVLFVGDGINDGAALARAHVGVSVRGGADLAAAVSAVALLGTDIGRVPWLIALARRTRQVVRQNLAWSFAYNSVCVALALSGRLAPVWAAVAMLLSSAFTLLSSLRLLRVEAPTAAEPDRETAETAPRAPIVEVT